MITSPCDSSNQKKSVSTMSTKRSTVTTISDENSLVSDGDGDENSDDWFCYDSDAENENSPIMSRSLDKDTFNDQKLLVDIVPSDSMESFDYDYIVDDKENDSEIVDYVTPPSGNESKSNMKTNSPNPCNNSGSGNTVLGELQTLRKISNIASLLQNEDINVQLSKSCKLSVLDMLLASLVQLPNTAASINKIVIVSNFTKMLDMIENLVKVKHYGECLRIDGKVSVDKRQDFVDRFNRKSDRKCNIFLLSARAGGVGLNL